MIEAGLQSIQRGLDAATPWLVGASAGCFFLWLALLMREKRPFEKGLVWFRGLAPLHRLVAVCAVCLFTLWGGSKERGILPSGLMDDISSTVSRVAETIQLRTLPENVASNAFAVTDFAVDSREKETAFGLEWAGNLFEDVDSRNVDLFMSTNLAVNGWFPLGRYLMPQGSNAFSFIVSSNDVVPACRPVYVDSFGRRAFFRFGLDFDSDGDGLTDSYENLVSLTDSSDPDTDGDGLSDAQELAVGIGTNPLLFDTDGDGVGDGDEVAAGSNPHAADTDGDGLPDVAELGTMTVLAEEKFMWLDLSDGTDLLVGSATADDNMWLVALPRNAAINNVCHTNALVCMNGVVHLLCPTNSGGIRYSGYGYSGGLSNTQWSATHVTVALFNADLYARTAEWGSRVLYGSVESGGRTFGVVEYRNVGLYSLRNAETNELLTCQLIIPDDETNTVYVSYLCASNALREIAAVVGVQCGRIRSWKAGETCYNLSWPLTSSFPEGGLTVKYSIGTGTDPCNPDTDGDGLSDAEEALGCRTDPLVADSDGDQLLDAEEIAIGTSPLDIDTDGDGMPDGWEALNGLDPLADDAAGDPDGDGLSNLREYALGTSPVSVDTDGDGLTDRDEVGWWEYADSMPVFDVSGGTNLLQTSRSYHADTFKVLLPFTVRYAGYVHTNMTVGVCGMVGLMSDRESGFSFSVPSGNRNLSDYRVSYYHTAVAAYWDDLCSPANSGARMTVADVETNGLRYAVVEYANIRLYSRRNDASCVATFQIVIPEAETNTVYVHYIDLADAFDGSGATVGAQLPNREQTHQVSFDTAGAVTNGMVVAYHLGTGSNPVVADTDGDGLDDGVEAAIGTSARHADTDLDGLADAWENANGLDPLSATDGNGAEGDPDGDHLSNAKEFECGTAPSVADTDGDGLRDGLETGSVFATNAIPWLSFDVSEDLTAEISTNRSRCVSRPAPVPLRIQGETVTNLTISANGLVFLDRAGYANSGDSTSGLNFKYVIDEDALVLAPYLQYAYVRSDIAGRRTSIRYGTAACGGVGYLLVEWLNVYCDTSTRRTNSISFQLAIPTNSPDRAYSRYSDVCGQYMDGRNASIGMQTFGGRGLHSWCYHSEGKVGDGLALEFLFGANSDPLVADTDGDGLTDGQEALIGTLPAKADSDGDGLLDGWEVENQLNPLSSSGDDGAAGDIDGDGLANFQEQAHGGNPRSADTDGDGLSDAQEVANGTNLGKTDSDSDGLTDKQEVDSGYDPFDPDMDRDGMPDGWEVSHGLNPRNAAGDDGADGDPDHDGLSNIDEYLNDTDPHAADTDGDGVSDRIEVEREADPTDPSDGGEAPPPDLFRTLTFNIYGDWAAWEMQIEGLGPEDTRTRRISMGAPAASEFETMKMRKGNSYRLTMRWLNCGDHHDESAPWYCWQAQIDGKPSECTYEGYSSARRGGVAERIAGNGWIAENEGGLLTAHVHENAKEGGNVAGGLTATLYVLGDPKVVPDYDRDGKIDSYDEAIYDTGQTTFRFWTNDDKDSGDVNVSRFDRPESGTNGWDGKVNGRGDLLDFTPVLLDVSGVFPPGTPGPIRERVAWRLASSAVNAVWTSLSASDAGRFLKADCGAAFGPGLSQDAHEATVTELAGGAELPDGFVWRMKNAGGRGVVMVEGRSSGKGLTLKGHVDDSTAAASEGTLDIEISSVEDMYRYVTLRGAHDNPSFVVQIPGRPQNLMDNGKDLDVFFTHGFNVSESDAHAWGSEVFKRLWQSGANARFWMFTWSGDYNWLNAAFNGLHYQQDVYQALKTGTALRAFMERAQPDPSKRILMAQSLGNMVACEALRQGLLVDKYFMFNAAVASEAVDGTLQNANSTVKAKYVPPDWNDYDPRSWAANWHRWFADDMTDSRGRMGWPDYFQPALSRAGTVYNYYSTGDSVFFESDTVPNVTTGLFHWPTLSWSWPFIDVNITAEEGSWQKQETHKGVEPIAGTLRGGWGFDCWYENVGGVSVPTFYAASHVHAMAANGSITNSPVFSYGGTPLNDRNASWDDIWLSLAKYVPAVSSPVGGTPTFDNPDRFCNLNSSTYRDGWGRSHNVYGQSWLHSDMKDMAYFYVYPLYDELREKGDLK